MMGDASQVTRGPTPAQVGTRRMNPVSAWVIATMLVILYGLAVRPLEEIRTKEDHRHAIQARLEQTDETVAGWHGQTYFRLILKHFASVAVIAAVLAMVGGVLGSSLGLPGLFRDPPERDIRQEVARRKKNKEYNRSRAGTTAFFGAFGASFLIALVWTTVFYQEVIEQREFFDSSHFTGKEFVGHVDLLWFLLFTATPFLGLLLVAEWFHAPAPGMERHGKERVLEFLHAALGVAAAVAVVIFMAWLGAKVHPYTEPVIERVYKFRALLPFHSHFLLIDELSWASLTTKARYSLVTSFTQFVLITGLGLLVFAFLFRRTLSPGLAICMLLALGVLFVSFLWWLSTSGEALLFVVLFAWLVWTNGDYYKYRFPGMSTYYEGGHVKIGELPKLFGKPAEKIGLLDNLQVLDRWRARTGQERPPLILVATTGGAYRASFWTTVVLEELQRYVRADFHRYIRLFTGASGGMVGAGYFVAAMTEDGPPAGGFTERLRSETGLDSLTPVVRRLLLGDLPRTLWPRCQSYDRGIALERQWETLGRTFKDLAEGEVAGWQPSLIVSPMVVESGRRLLISNLDLSCLAEARAQEPPRSNDGEGPLAEAARVYSRSAIEFFRIFPEARPTFSLQTAVRMSATFPLASPAVSLPTEPPRRVVDAGYYDNYGVDLATSWIYAHRRWIQDNTSGVALIQIRAYPSEQEVLSYFGDEAGDRNGFAWLRDRVVASVQGVTSPLAGGLSAREWSMRFRNATQVRILDDLLNTSGNRSFFQTFIFENFNDFAMNWFLSDDDIDGMRRSIGAGDLAYANGGPGAGVGDVGGTRSNSERARKARKACHEVNQKQKQNLKKWFEQRRTWTEPEGVRSLSESGRGLKGSDPFPSPGSLGPESEGVRV